MKTITWRQLLLALLLWFPFGNVTAQCSAGYSQFTLNWDFLDFFIYNGNYTNLNGYLPSLAAAQTQNFAFGSQRVTITHNYAATNFSGENTTHSGENNTYGNTNASAVDADVQFIGDGVIQVTFDAEVRNVKFSIYDIDREQQVTFDARNTANVQQNITLSTPLVTILTINNNNSTGPDVVAPSTNVGVNLNTASVNVDIAGPVKSFTLTITNTATNGGENGSFWLSDITACTPGSFPANYYAVSKPFTGQPGYVLHALNNKVYAVDPATGVTKLMFTDAAAPGNISSMAYDPYNKFLYYAYTGTGSAGNNRTIKKFDFNTETISTVLADINTIGIPTSSFLGIESGGAAFYNGALYLGIETSNVIRTSGREAIIWRIDFDASNVPYRASQVYGLPTDDGSGLIHDWGDFTIYDGILYDFDGSSNESDVYHYNMSTGAVTRYLYPPFVPGQVTVDWQGNLFQLQSDPGNGIAPYIAPYIGGDLDGAAEYNLTSSPMFTPAIPVLEDAAEAFRPKSDFGDAPASYDPGGVDPATHEYVSTMRLGSTYDYEWVKTTVVNGDGADEDGLAGAPVLNFNATLPSYSITVNAFNNSGAPATVAAWIDFNFNGRYDVNEGVTTTIPSSPAAQLVPLTWNNIWVYPTTNLSAWVRLRITAASLGMTAANMNGYYPIGEVEDHTIVLGTNLAKELLTFSANLNSSGAVDVKWLTEFNADMKGFEVERSNNSRQWESIRTVQATTDARHSYSIIDASPLTGLSYYRLKVLSGNGTFWYSEIKSVYIGSSTSRKFQVLVNPASTYTILKIDADVNGPVTVYTTDNNGRTVIQKVLQLKKGENLVRMDEVNNLSAGLYYVYVYLGDERYVEKMLVKKD